MLIPMYIYMYLEPLYEINLTFLTFFVGNKIINQVFFERSNFFLEIMSTATVSLMSFDKSI